MNPKDWHFSFYSSTAIISSFEINNPKSGELHFAKELTFKNKKLQITHAHKILHALHYKSAFLEFSQIYK